MLHRDRTWKVVEVDLDDLDDLAAKLTEQTWTRCTGWRWGQLYLLNDSTHPDGAQEYAVVDAETGEQIETITFSWCDRSRARYHLLKCASYQVGEDEQPMRVGNWLDQIEPASDHARCHLCR